MSLTGTHHVFASVSEAGINTFLQAIFTARPHYLNYGSSFFVPSSSASATNMGSIPFPGIPGGVQWAVTFAIPVLDLYPPDSGSSPLPPPPGCFSVHTTATITIGCMTWYGRDKQGYQTVPITTVLDVWAVGEVVPTYYGPGTGYISFKIDKVLLPGIQPGSLEAMLECLIRMLLSAAIQSTQIPFHAISLGALTLALEAGPTIQDNQVEVWGSI